MQTVSLNHTHTYISVAVCVSLLANQLGFDSSTFSASMQTFNATTNLKNSKIPTF